MNSARVFWFPAIFLALGILLYTWWFREHDKQELLLEVRHCVELANAGNHLALAEFMGPDLVQAVEMRGGSVEEGLQMVYIRDSEEGARYSNVRLVRWEGGEGFAEMAVTRTSMKEPKGQEMIFPMRRYPDKMWRVSREILKMYEEGMMQ